jgi:hypothetical protein
MRELPPLHPAAAAVPPLEGSEFADLVAEFGPAA